MTRFYFFNISRWAIFYYMSRYDALWNPVFDSSPDILLFWQFTLWSIAYQIRELVVSLTENNSLYVYYNIAKSVKIDITIWNEYKVNVQIRNNIILRCYMYMLQSNIYLWTRRDYMLEVWRLSLRNLKCYNPSSMANIYISPTHTFPGSSRIVSWKGKWFPAIASNMLSPLVYKTQMLVLFTIFASAYWFQQL